MQGPERAHTSKILPWAHTVFGNLETWLRGTFQGVSHEHLRRYLESGSMVARVRSSARQRGSPIRVAGKARE